MQNEPPQSEPPRVARDLRIAVGRLSRQLRRIYGKAQADNEPSFLELAVLLRVERTGPSSASALAAGERVTAQAVSAALAGLRRRGLVDLTTDANDRRRSRVEINDAGLLMLAAREQHVGDRLTEVVTANFSAVELERLAAAAPLLDRLADLL
jgi:DNA-binding MarR family transcriptional regulator